MEDERKPLSKGQTTATMAVKCYREQLLNEEELVDAIHSIPPEEFYIIAIKHDKSMIVHWHILVRAAYREKRVRVSSMLKRLKVQFRDGIDDTLWENHGVETVGNFKNCVTDLLHKTIEDQRAGKVPYDETEFISNLSADEIHRILIGYSIAKKPLTQAEYSAALDKAREAGHELKSVDEFISSLQIFGLNPTKESGIRKAYLNGVKELMREHKRMYRLFINISCDQADEKEKLFYAAKKALDDKRISASMDDRSLMLDPSKEAIITTISNLDKNLYGDYICEVGKPVVTEKTIWAGSILVLIGEWKSLPEREKYFVCFVKDNKLKCDSPPSITLPPEEAKRLKGEYKEFRDKFNIALDEFDVMQNACTVSFDDIND